MLDQAFESLPCEIQAIEGCVPMLKVGDEPQRMRVVIEPANRGRGFVQRLLAGVSEGGVSEIMRKGNCLRQILIQCQNARKGTRDLPHLQRMCEAGPVEIALMLHE